jgi:hypothetical protein
MLTQKFNMMKFLQMIFTLNYFVSAGEVIYSTFMGGATQEHLQTQYDQIQTYASNNVITTSSILLYGIDDFGEILIYNTSDSANWTATQFQLDVGN